MSNNWIAYVLLLVLVIGAGYWYLDRQPVESRQQESKVDQADETEDTGPRYPLRSFEPVDPASLVPLPDLDDSDSWFELALADLFGDALKETLDSTRLIEKVVVTVDNLPRSKIATDLRPLETVAGTFNTTVLYDETFQIDPENYRRYDSLVDLLESADLEEALLVYQRYYPLMQQAYEDLGYPNAYFNDRLVEVIDHLLLTPEVDEPVTLVRPHVLYQFADVELEDLSGGQKILVRMGNSNAARVKAVLTAFREHIVDQGSNQAATE